MQGLLVKAWKGCHIKKHTSWCQKQKDVEILQSAKIFDKSPILNIFEILAHTVFIEKDQDDDQNQVTPSLICQHIKLRIYNIINCYMIHKVLLFVI